VRSLAVLKVKNITADAPLVLSVIQCEAVKVLQWRDDMSWGSLRIAGHVAVVALALMLAGGALHTTHANDSFDTFVNTRERGILNSHGDTLLPWVRRYLGEAGTCVTFRIAAVSKPGMVDLVVVGPDPAVVWRSGYHPNQVVLRAGWSGGYFTVLVLPRPPAAPKEFLLDYARRSASSSDICGDPTPPESLTTDTVGGLHPLPPPVTIWEE
jgi:hypothetical protein